MNEIVFKEGDLVRMIPNQVNPPFGAGAYSLVYADYKDFILEVGEINEGGKGFVPKNIVKARWMVSFAWCEHAKPYTYKQLYDKAKELKIVRRSLMNKGQLDEAIKAWKPPPPPIKNEFTLGEELVKKSLEHKQKAGVTERCSYAKEFDTGKRVFNVADICHARIPWNGIGGVNECTAIAFDIARHHRDHETPKEYLEFVDYMLNRSPWANCFLTKDVQKALKEGVYGNVDVGVSRLSCSAIALRQGSEFPHKLNTFIFLKNKGFSENLSWFMAQGVHKADEWRKSGIEGWHDTFESVMNLDDVVQFFNTGWHTEEGLPLRKSKSHYSIFKSIGSSYDGPQLKTFFNNLKTTVIGTGWDEKRAITEENVLELANQAKELIKS